MRAPSPRSGDTDIGRPGCSDAGVTDAKLNDARKFDRRVPDGWRRRRSRLSGLVGGLLGEGLIAEAAARDGIGDPQALRPEAPGAKGRVLLSRPRLVVRTGARPTVLAVDVPHGIRLEIDRAPACRPRRSMPQGDGANRAATYQAMVARKATNTMKPSPLASTSARPSSALTPPVVFRGRRAS